MSKTSDDLAAQTDTIIAETGLLVESYAASRDRLMKFARMSVERQEEKASVAHPPAMPFNP